MLMECFSLLPDWTWLLTGLIGLVTLILVNHILVVRSLPPGPFPLPFLGNLLVFRGVGNSPKAVMNRLARQYKDIYSIWLGPKPTVMVCSWDLCREALIVKRNDFSGRILRKSFSLFLGEHQDVIMSDFGPCWTILRKILHTAVRKYAVSEKLAVLSTDVVDMAVEDMLKKRTPIDTKDYIYLILYNVLASSSFGKRYLMTDPEFVGLRDLNDDLNESFGTGLPSDAVPALSIFYRKEENLIRDLSREFNAYVSKQFYEHKRTYQKGIVRDFTDAVLASRQEAQEEGSDHLEFLTDGNLVLTLVDLFSAGTDTTRVTLLWLLLLMCEHPEVQMKMAAEIEENIGSRPPNQEDRHTCHYITATIFETLRFRPVIDSTLEHKTICDTELGQYKLPKGTSCLFHITSTHNDETNFKDCHLFKPERFLEQDGRFTNSRLSGYMPFGLGRRACPGEKLALADVFLIITRLLQQCSFQLEGGPGSVSLEPSQTDFANFPLPYKLIVKKRNDDM